MELRSRLGGQQFGDVKVRYLGLFKNSARLNTFLCALSNLRSAWRMIASGATVIEHLQKENYRSEIPVKALKRHHPISYHVEYSFQFFPQLVF